MMLRVPMANNKNPLNYDGRIWHGIADLKSIEQKRKGTQ